MYVVMLRMYDVCLFDDDVCLVDEDDGVCSMYLGMMQYVFDVDVTATKPEIKAAVEALFNVTVNAVNVINVAGKRKMFKGRAGRRNAVRKAIVSLQAGQQIEFTSAE